MDRFSKPDSKAISFGQTKIEGLFYLDKTPVSVEIKDGKIVEVKRIEKLSDEKNPLYIARDYLTTR